MDLGEFQVDVLGLRHGDSAGLLLWQYLQVLEGPRPWQALEVSPSMFLQIAACAALIKIIHNPDKYDKFAGKSETM